MPASGEHADSHLARPRRSSTASTRSPGRTSAGSSTPAASRSPRRCCARPRHTPSPAFSTTPASARRSTWPATASGTAAATTSIAPIAELRDPFYRHLAPVANAWSELLSGYTQTFPPEHAELLARCREAGRERPTPPVLRYGPGYWNALHQDLYGDVSVPFQVLTVLSEPGIDYEGGELVLMDQRPRAQSRAHVLSPPRGAFVIFPPASGPTRASTAITVSGCATARAPSPAAGAPRWGSSSTTRAEEGRRQSPPSDSNREPPNYKFGALPVELGGLAATSVDAGGASVGVVRVHVRVTAPAGSRPAVREGTLPPAIDTPAGY